MANDYFQKGAAIIPFTTAKAEDVIDEFSKVEAAFDKLPKPKDDGTGFVDPVNVGNATEAGHAVNKGQFDAVVGGVFVARDEAQQAASTATAKANQASTDATQVSNNAAQVATQSATVNAQHSEVGTKHADVVAKHGEVVTKHSDVVTKHGEVTTKHADVVTKHGEVNAARDTTIQTSTDFNKLNLGAKAAEPTLDNNGDPLIDGCWYYNTTNNNTYVRVGGLFVLAGGAYEATFPRLLHNTDMTNPVNQKGFDGNWTVLAVDDQGWDLWRKYDDNRMFQVVEDGSYVPNAHYILQADGVVIWQGKAPSSGHWGVAIPITADQIDLRMGEVVVPWHPEDPTEKSLKCQRQYHYRKGTYGVAARADISADSANEVFSGYSFPVEMRVTPSVDYVITNWTTSSGKAYGATKNGFTFHGICTTTSAANVNDITADATLKHVDVTDWTVI
ncbi:hypothetical protein TW81_02230 [Vibrio galatheae]|uniref:Uncharacterized protein n=1 Tax=Vibrio galatheae TaxID=579748 RepID=A0A0F4NNZ1_9VIBR|nr:hypothetical protein [Vibrio galatheae]KJY84832.1 hypothetical protein TW81_02230 [Vibrio galatheae]